MTLTEEQREAIRVISKLPMAIGCQLCHPYIMENYGSHFIVLRDMIDSSGTVELREGFDLERARGLRDFLQDDCAEVGDVWGEMIAEIERLRASLVEHEEHENQTHAILGAILGTDDTLENVAKRAMTRIAELEDALVEGLTNFLHYCASCYDPARRCPYAKECDDCSTWDACGHVEMFRSEARRQLQAEGKIGPDAKPRVWQITEERIGLLEYCLETLLDAPDIEEIPGPGHSIEMLRAMLREAE